MTTERRTRLLLAAVLVAGFALRAWLAWGSPLRAGTFYDERFSFRNERVLVGEGRIRPDNAYYPSLSYLPHGALLAASEGLHRLTGIDTLSIYAPGGDGFSPTAYAIARGVSVVVGTGCLLLLFLVGRRLFDERVGLLAAAILAAAPIHILTSARFKPDVLVDLFALLTLGWTLRATARPTARAFLLAGCGVGLAAASKYNGAAVASVVVAAVLAAGWDRRRWGGLVLAGLSSIVVFVALNPFLGLVAEFVGRQMEIYDAKASVEGWSHGQVLKATFLRVATNLGWLPALFAVAGTIGMGARLVGDRVPGERRAEAGAVLGLLLGIPVVYAASTTLFRGQNILPVVGCAALLAAWPAVAAWDRAVAWLGKGTAVRRCVAAAAVAVLAIVHFLEPAGVIYRRVVPSTHERVEQILASELDPIGLRTVVYEGEEAGLRPRRGGDVAAVVPAERLTRLDPEVLWRADAEVFPVRRLEGEESNFYLRRLAQKASRARRVVARPFHLRGPDLGIVLHSWKLVGEPIGLRLEPAGGRGAWRAVATDGYGASEPAEVASRVRMADGTTGGGGALSLTLWLPVEPGGPLPRAVRVAGYETALLPTGASSTRVRFLSGRIPFPSAVPAGGAGHLPIEILGGGSRPDRAPVDATLHLWVSGRSPEGPAGADKLSGLAESAG